MPEIAEKYKRRVYGSGLLGNTPKNMQIWGDFEKFECIYPEKHLNADKTRGFGVFPKKKTVYTPVLQRHQGRLHFLGITEQY